MQNLTADPRSHLSADQVRALLTGEDVQRSHGAELLDDSNRVIEDLGEDVRDWTVTYASGTGEEVHGSLNIELTRRLDWGRARVRPYIDLTLSELATTVRTVIDRPAKSEARTWDDAADWATGTASNVDGSSGVLRLPVDYPGHDAETVTRTDNTAGEWAAGTNDGTTGASGVLTLATGEVSGSWVSPPLDLSGLAAVDGSSIDWSAATPSGTSVTVETSADGGATWDAATDGGAIVGAAAGGDVRARLTLTGDPGKQPVTMPQSSYTFTGSSLVPIDQALLPKSENMFGNDAFDMRMDVTWNSGTGAVYGEGSNDGFSYDLVEVTSSGAVRIRFVNQGTTELSMTTPLYRVSAGVPFNLRVVRSGMNFTLYIDGGVAATGTWAKGAWGFPPTNPTGQAALGGVKWSWKQGNYFTGTIANTSFGQSVPATYPEVSSLTLTVSQDQQAPIYAGSGSWTSPALSAGDFDEVTSSLVEWTASTPSGTGVTVETSVDGGASWQATTDGGSINGATADGTAHLRVNLTSDGVTTPEVSSTFLAVYQAELTHTEAVTELTPYTGRFYAGVYVLTAPDTQHGRSPRIYNTAGKNLLYLLDRQVGETYVITAGTTYLDALRQVIADAGLSIPVQLDGSRQDTTLPKDRVWAVGDTRWLDIANDLMAEIAYLDLFCNEVGTFRSQPVMPVEARGAEWEFDTRDEHTDLIDEDFTESEDRHGEFNQWSFVRRNMAYQPVNGDGLFVYPAPVGTPVDEIRPAPLMEIEAADQAALEAEGLRIVAADQRTTHSFTISVDPLPIAGHRDVVRLTLEDGSRHKMQVTSWQLRPYGKGTWVLGGGTGGNPTEPVERQTKATVTQASPLRVVVDGAQQDSPANALDGATYGIGDRLTVTVRNPSPPLVAGEET